jgi:hypothetical protein
LCSNPAATRPPTRWAFVHQGPLTPAQPLLSKRAGHGGGAQDNMVSLSNGKSLFCGPFVEAGWF